MIIWILNHYAIAPHSIGGTRHYDLANELVKDGHKVRIFASSFNHLERRETVTYGKGYFKEEIFEGVNFTWIKTPSYHSTLKRLLNIGVFSSRLNRVLDKYLKDEKPDLIIGSSVHPLTPLIGIRKAKKVNALFYFEERDLWPQTFIDFGMMTERNPISKFLFKAEEYLYKHSDRVIFLFEKAHEYAFTKGLNKDKPIYIPNGYSIDRTNSIIESEVISDICSNYKGKKLCIYVGSMGEANHMMPLLELAKVMQDEKDFHFLFVGNGPLKESLIKYSDNEDLNNVTFEEPIAKEDIPYLLSHAHCGLISMKDSPLYNWGFSMNKIYDYLSLGLPILMYSNLDDIGKLKESQGVYSTNSVEELKRALLEEREVSREEIIKFAYENFSWRVLSKRLLTEIEITTNESNLSK